MVEGVPRVFGEDFQVLFNSIVVFAWLTFSHYSACYWSKQQCNEFRSFYNKEERISFFFRRSCICRDIIWSTLLSSGNCRFWRSFIMQDVVRLDIGLHSVRSLKAICLCCSWDIYDSWKSFCGHFMQLQSHLGILAPCKGKILALPWNQLVKWILEMDGKWQAILMWDLWTNLSPEGCPKGCCFQAFLVWNRIWILPFWSEIGYILSKWSWAWFSSNMSPQTLRSKWKITGWKTPPIKKPCQNRASNNEMQTEQLCDISMFILLLQWLTYCHLLWLSVWI